MKAIVLAANLIWLHLPDGADVSINVDEVVSMRGPRSEGDDKMFTENAKCLINTTDGRFITVRETCNEVMRIFVETEKQP